MFLTHFKFTSQPFAERVTVTVSEVIYPESAIREQLDGRFQKKSPLRA